MVLVEVYDLTIKYEYFSLMDKIREFMNEGRDFVLSVHKDKAILKSKSD